LNTPSNLNVRNILGHNHRLAVVSTPPDYGGDGFVALGTEGDQVTPHVLIPEPLIGLVVDL
jgi:hypothetical protein